MMTQPGLASPYLIVLGSNLIAIEQDCECNEESSCKADDVFVVKI